MMIAITDVHYENDRATAACLLAQWNDEEPSKEWTAQVSGVAPYQPGRFFERELPSLLAVLEDAPLDALEAVVIDGYVWLDADQRMGLGAHLWEELNRAVPVVGVAKNAYGDGAFAVSIERGESRKPLYVTAAGVEAAWAAKRVVAMHGEYRIPTLLRRVDLLCRGEQDS